MVACTYPKLIAACHVLPHLSSRVILQPASSHQFAAFLNIDSQSWKITRTYVKQSFFIFTTHIITSVVIAKRLLLLLSSNNNSCSSNQSVAWLYFLLFLLLLILYMTLIVNLLRLLHPSFLIIKQGIASSLARFFFTFWSYKWSCSHDPLHKKRVIRPHSKEVIRPQVPLRPPCYDFSLVADPRFDSANEAPPRQEPTSMKRRAVCARSRDVFTARCWHAVTRDSIFMRASFSPQS